MPHSDPKPIVDLFVDANLIHGGNLNLFGTADFNDTIKQLAGDFNLKVLFPELVSDEILHQRALAIEQAYQIWEAGAKAQSALTGQPPVAFHKLETLKRRLLKSAKSDFEKRGYQIAKCKIKQTGFRKIARNAVWREELFSRESDPSAFRDTIIWQTVLAADFRKGAKRVFVTRDGSGKKGGLFSYIKDNYKGPVIVVPSLDQLRALAGKLTAEEAAKVKRLVSAASSAFSGIQTADTSTVLDKIMSKMPEISTISAFLLMDTIPGLPRFTMEQRGTEILEYVPDGVSKFLTKCLAITNVRDRSILALYTDEGTQRWYDVTVTWTAEEASGGLKDERLTEISVKEERAVKIPRSEGVLSFAANNSPQSLGVIGPVGPIGMVTSAISDVNRSWMSGLGMQPSAAIGLTSATGPNTHSSVLGSLSPSLASAGHFSSPNIGIDVTKPI